MKKILLALLLVLAMSTPTLALTLPLTYSNVNGSGTYGALQLTDISGGVEVAANYAYYTPAAGFGVQDVYLNLIVNSYDINFIQVGRQIDGGITPSDTPNPGTWSLVTSGAGLQADGLGIFTLNATSGGGANARIPIVESSSDSFTPLFRLMADGLTTEDFLAYSQKGGEDTQWYAAMHLAGYVENPAGNPSSYLAATPIPGSLILFGSGLLGLVGIARNRLKK